MNKLSDNIFFPSKYIDDIYGEHHLVINFDNNKSRKLDKKEYEMFCYLKELKNAHYDRDIRDKIDNDLEYNRFVRQMIMSGLIALKPFDKVNPDRLDQMPHSVYWGISSDCNFRCKYCYADCETIKDISLHDSMSIDKYQTVIDKIKEYGFVEIVFTGGEPLLNKNVFEMAYYAKEKGLYCGLLTNGSLVKKFDIENFKIFDYVKISIDSANRDHNDRLRGKGSFDRIVEAIKLLREYDINVHIGSVITELNKEDLEELITFLYTEYGVTVHTLANHIPVGRGCTDDLSCSFEDLEKCDQVIMDTKWKLSQNGLYSIIQDSFFPESRKVVCGMGMSEVFIDDKGDVYPCRMTYSSEYYLGNILQEDFNDILDRVKDVTSKLHVDRLEGCKDCDYRYLCGGGCRIYHKAYSGSIYKNHIPICEAYKRQLKSVMLIKNKMPPIKK
ncbi:MAG: radical SAM protein [Eubacterium sp.]|nr:radical SAM protein [Eubacterium sp.]